MAHARACSETAPLDPPMLRAGVHAPKLHRASLAELQRSHASISGVHHCASADRQGHCLLLQQHDAIEAPAAGASACGRDLGMPVFMPWRGSFWRFWEPQQALFTSTGSEQGAQCSKL